MKQIKNLLLVFMLLLISSCAKENPLASPSQVMPICNLNNTPTLFLYPALDLSSDTPRFFNNTEYEIIREVYYLGKFKGDRFNHSFLNLTYGDRLGIIISAQDEKCYIPNDYLEYFVDCNPIQYVNPRLHCANKFDLDIRDEIFNKLESNRNYVELELRFFNKPEDFDFFGCNYDRNYV